ncbi:hypothetical protein MVEN_02412300 [Mycena venus]|uniref:Uncharacterized protein n=1 Tax=Mycena venus TaxID=2733690 RepID=A0A8H7CEI4_9AGAR|nr:hypothetical protein MVEN_02412300 [Mycena venus]
MNQQLATHPCYKNPNPRSRLKPETTFTLKYIKMCSHTIPANYPYALFAIAGLYAEKGSVYEYLPVPFFEFRGYGAPPADVGTPGDVYIDLTPGAHALYSRSEEDWARWAGPAAPEMLGHPHFFDYKQSRYVNFHPEEGIEWVCKQTILRRKEALRAAGFLKNRHAASAQAGFDLVSMIIGMYLASTAVDAKGLSSPTPHEDGDSDLFASDSESSDAESKVSEAFYLSKRARTVASSSSVSAALVANRSKSKAPPSSPPSAYRHPSPDPDIMQLEKVLKVLQADKELQSLRRRKRELMASLPTTRGFELAPELVQTLEKEYNKYYPSAVPSVAPAEAKQALPELRCRVDQTKKTLLATKMRRAEVEKQLAERRQWCEAIRQKHQEEEEEI